MNYNFFAYLLQSYIFVAADPPQSQSSLHKSLTFILPFDHFYELEDLTVWNQRNKIFPSKFHFQYMLFACPAETTNEKAIDTKSLNKKSLFVRNIIDQTLAEKTSPDICLNKYEPSVITLIPSPDTTKLQLGEIHTKQEILTMPTRHRIGYEIWDTENLLKSYRLPPMNHFTRMTAGSGWIDGLKVIYDWQDLVVRQVSYTLNSFVYTDSNVQRDCLDYNVGQRLFARQLYELYYTRQLQDDALNDFERPQIAKAFRSDNPATSPSEDETEIAKVLISMPQSSPANTSKKRSADESAVQPTEKSKPSYDYFVMQQLAASFFINVPSVRAVTCSYLNVAPMWQTIADGIWRTIDLTIDKVLFFVDRLFVTAGTYDTLFLPIRDSQAGRENAVYLNRVLNKIAVPRIFWKCVAYRVHLPATAQPIFYAIVIVVHNHPSTRSNPLCTRNCCLDNGWHLDTISDTVQSYCCYPTRELVQILNIDSSVADAIVGIFDLNDVIVGYDRHDQPVRQNIAESINVSTFGQRTRRPRDTDRYKFERSSNDVIHVS